MTRKPSKWPKNGLDCMPRSEGEAVCVCVCVSLEGSQEHILPKVEKSKAQRYLATGRKGIKKKGHSRK